MVIAFPPDPANPVAGLTQEEVIDLMHAQEFLKEETGYQRIQGTKPQTLGYALNDSPAGLAAWIVEKFRTWSDYRLRGLLDAANATISGKLVWAAPPDRHEPPKHGTFQLAKQPGAAAAALLK